jgi:hypothetical protein
METELSLKELVAQYGSMDHHDYDAPAATVTTTTATMICTGQWWRKYALYIYLFVWTILVVIITRPKSMTVVDKDTGERKLRVGRVLATILGIYATVLGVIFGVRLLA